MAEKEIKLNIDVKIPEDIRDGLTNIDAKLKDLDEKIASIEIPEPKDHTEQLRDLSNKMDYEEEIVVKLNII